MRKQTKPNILKELTSKNSKHQSTNEKRNKSRSQIKTRFSFRAEEGQKIKNLTQQVIKKLHPNQEVSKKLPEKYFYQNKILKEQKKEDYFFKYKYQKNQIKSQTGESGIKTNCFETQLASLDKKGFRKKQKALLNEKLKPKDYFEDKYDGYSKEGLREKEAKSEDLTAGFQEQDDGEQFSDMKRRIQRGMVDSISDKRRQGSTNVTAKYPFMLNEALQSEHRSGFKKETIKKIEMSDIEKISEDINEDESDQETNGETLNASKEKAVTFIEESEIKGDSQAVDTERKQKLETFQETKEKNEEVMSDESNSTEVRVPNTTNFVLDLDMTVLKSNSLDPEKQKEAVSKQNFKKQAKAGEIEEIGGDEKKGGQEFQETLEKKVNTQEISSFVIDKQKEEGEGGEQAQKKEGRQSIEDSSDNKFTGLTSLNKSCRKISESFTFEMNDSESLLKKSKSSQKLVIETANQDRLETSHTSPSLKNLDRVFTLDNGIVPREFVHNKSKLGSGGWIFN